jgi:APA family basic amino acid/polyamine antiporter
MLEPKLTRTLNLGSSISIVTGSVIGSGVFLVGSDIAKQVADPWAALSVWLVAGFFSLIGGLIFAELGAHSPEAGGQYHYLRKGFGPLMGFLFAWTHTLILLPGTLAALAVGVATFSQSFLDMSPTLKSVFASFVLLLLTLLNLFGLKKASAVLDVLTVVRIVALVGIVFGAYLFFSPTQSTLAPVLSQTHSWSWAKYGIALIAAFWAFEGWNGLSQVASEVKNPKKNIPIASFVGILIPLLLYLGVNAAFMRVLGSEKLALSSFAGSDSALLIWGPVGALIISALVVLSTLGCLNSTVITGSRVIYAGGADRVFPKFLGFVHPKFNVPSHALWLQFILAAALIWTKSYDQLFTYVICAAFLFYALCALALIVIRKREGAKIQTYKVPFFPLLPMLYIAFILLFVGNAFLERPYESVIGAVIVIAGIPVYFLLQTPSLKS